MSEIDQKREQARNIVLRMGYPDTENGPYVVELRCWVFDQVCQRGMIGASSGTWRKNDLSYEERAREYLAVVWEMDNSYSTPVRCWDPIICRRFDARTLKSTVEINWRNLPDRMLDWRDSQLMFIKRLVDRKILKKTNPYIKKV